MVPRYLIAALFALSIAASIVLPRANKDIELLRAEIAGDFEVISRSEIWKASDEKPRCSELTLISQTMVKETKTSLMALGATNYVREALNNACIDRQEATQQLGTIKTQYELRIQREKHAYWGLRIMSAAFGRTFPYPAAADKFQP